jgi:hypothetical protein
MDFLLLEREKKQKSLQGFPIVRKETEATTIL